MGHGKNNSMLMAGRAEDEERAMIQDIDEIDHEEHRHRSRAAGSARR